MRLNQFTLCFVFLCCSVGKGLQASLKRDLEVFDMWAPQSVPSLKALSAQSALIVIEGMVARGEEENIKKILTPAAIELAFQAPYRPIVLPDESLMYFLRHYMGNYIWHWGDRYILPDMTFMSHLTSLDLSVFDLKCYLVINPDFLLPLSKSITLRELNLSKNRLGGWVCCLSAFMQIRVLDISHNELEESVSVLSALTNLEKLDGSHNRLGSDVAVLSSLVSLKFLNVSCNRRLHYRHVWRDNIGRRDLVGTDTFGDGFDALTKLTSLEILNVSGNALGPQGTIVLNAFVGLKALNFLGCGLISTPEALTNLTQLKVVTIESFDREEGDLFSLFD